MEPRPSTTIEKPRLLRRPLDRRLVGGVASGLSDHLDIDVVLVRIGFVALALCGGLGLPLYLAAWVLVPEEGSDLAIADHLMSRVRTPSDPSMTGWSATDDGSDRARQS